MHLIDIDRGVDSLNVGIDLAAGMLYTKGERVGDILHHFIQVEFLLLEHRLLLVKHTHLEHLLDQESQAFRLIIDNRAQVFLHLLTLGNRWVVEHLGCQRDAGDRCFQLMRHIIDEVILDLRIFLLSEYHDDGEDEGNQQHDGEDDARNHKPHAGEDVAVHIREVNLHDTHLRLWVVAEQHLRITIFLALVGIVWATIDLSAILRCHREVIRDVDAIVHHLRLEVLVKLLEVDAFLQRFVGCRIEDGIDHLVEQCLLIDISILHDFL